AADAFALGDARGGLAHARRERHDGGTTARSLAEEAHGLERGLGVAHDDVLEPRAEGAGEGAGELGRALDAIGEQTEDAALGARRGALAEAGHEGTHAGAHALEAGLDLLERAEAAALLADLVAESVDGAHGGLELVAEALELGLDRGAALGGVFLAAAEPLEAGGELFALLLGVGDARLELGALHREALLAPGGLLAAAERALERGVGARDAHADLARALAEGVEAALGLGGCDLELLHGVGLGVDEALRGVLGEGELVERFEE